MASMLCPLKDLESIRGPAPDGITIIAAMNRRQEEHEARRHLFISEIASNSHPWPPWRLLYGQSDIMT
jgi:hypothetical protein